MSGNNAGLAQDLTAFAAALICTSTQVLSAHSAPFVLRLVPVFNLNTTPYQKVTNLTTYIRATDL
jgi:hypothetical protein